ncbi:MAG: hypothetical protein U0002_11855 [Thermoanaerobaculia bacterium]
MPADSTLPGLPSRPAFWQEQLGGFLLRFRGPKLGDEPQPPPPPDLAPFEPVAIPRTSGPGSLSAHWFPASGKPRGKVLLLHPWLVWGQAYFYRRGRIEALRQAGYHALTVDLPGFGGSGAPHGLYHRAVSDAHSWLENREPDLPLHAWGVSSGGYWAHPVISSGSSVLGAFYEDVSPHLLEWSWRMYPWGRPFYLFFRTVIPRAYRFIDMRRHAAARKAAASFYVSGERDLGVRPSDTQDLARAAGGESLIVPNAGHLAAIKLANQEVLARALETFARAESSAPRASR